MANGNLTPPVLVPEVGSPYLSEKDLRFIVQDIGPQLIDYFPVEERLAGLTTEEIEAYLKRLKSQSSKNRKSDKK